MKLDPASVSCPSCGANPGAACVGKRGSDRKSFHAARLGRRARAAPAAVPIPRHSVERFQPGNENVWNDGVAGAPEGRLEAMLFARASIHSVCASPIERLFVDGLLTGLFSIASRGMPRAIFPHDGFDFGIGLQVAPQYEIGPYRVDFAILMAGLQGKWAKVIVECDGHDFHERTKEQAARDKARDRFIAIQGWQVLRFTGSEIYRDVRKCVVQVEQFLDSEWRRSPPRSAA